MRKNNLFLVLLTALIVMSCSKDETTMSTAQEGNAIEFGTYVGRDAKTRALSVETPALLASGGGFGVFAYYTGQNVYGHTAIKPNFMYNQGVTSADAGANWTYSPVKYWPNNVDDKVSFFAYAPFGNTNVTVPLVAAFSAGDPIITFAVNGTAKDQVDLLYADATENMKNRIKNGTSPNQIGINEKITFKFKHALARIGFNVEAMVDEVNGKETGDLDASPETGNGTIDENTKIVVTKVELIGNFYPSGTLNLNNTVANTPIWTPAAATARTFELTPTDNFETVADHGEATFTTTGQLVTSATPKQKLNNDDSYLMVIPQTFATGNEIKIRVTYDVITADGNLNTGQSKITNVITSDEFTFNFEHGKAYTFNLHLGMTSVKFDASVTPWDETTPGTVVNVPINLIEQSEPESNSYIVAPNSAAIRIPVSRANASDLLTQPQLSDGDIFTAELVWTDNENGVEANSNIKSIAVDGTGPTGFLVIEPGSASGNAVVAIKKDGVILWSWHIWVTNETPASIGGFMDRNLGAIGKTPGAVGTKGLLYQWGCKDPFPSSATINSNTEPVVYNASDVITISKTATTAPNNFGNSVANPFTFYLGAGANGNDWFSSIDTHDNTLWGYRIAKTVYDPCPEGWRVPEKDDHENYVMPALGVWETNNIGRTNSTYGGFYPAAGSRGSDDGSLKNLPSTSWGNPYRAYYWSSRATNVMPNSFNFGDSYQNIHNENSRAVGCSMRCVRDE